jgi:hypothetical protein
VPGNLKFTWAITALIREWPILDSEYVSSTASGSSCGSLVVRYIGLDEGVELENETDCFGSCYFHDSVRCAD